MIDLINGLLKVIGVVFGQLIGLMPQSPLHIPQSAFDTVNPYMGYASWFLPLGEIVTVVTGLLAAILVWYGIRIVLRFFRVVAS